MPVGFDDINIEKANEYFLVPLQDKDSIFYLGNKNKLNAFMIVAEASLVTATGGVQSSNTEDQDGTKCYIFLDTDREGVQKILKDVDEVMVKSLNNNVV